MPRSGPGRQPKGASKTPAGWERLLPFPKGGAFEVAVSRPWLPVRGRGTVLQRSPARVHLQIDFPGFLLVPKVRVEVLLEARRDGPGNSGTVHVTAGKRKWGFTDEDLTVSTSPDGRVREITPSTSHHGYHGTAVIRADQDGVCRASALSFEVRLSGETAGPTSPRRARAPR